MTHRRALDKIWLRRCAHRLKPATDVHLGVSFTAVMPSSGRVGGFRVPPVYGEVGISTSNHEPVGGTDGNVAPPGMKDSGFLISSEQKRRVATFHNRQPDGGLVTAPFEMPQRPEFFMGGGGAFSTHIDYMTFLQMLLQRGSLKGVRILRPETIAVMSANQIGDLNVHEMRTAKPALSNSFDQFPGRHTSGACRSTATSFPAPMAAARQAFPGRAYSTPISGSIR